jgi:hypothetical protein
MATSLFGYFNGNSGGIESHLHIPITNKYDIEQYRSCHVEADANYRGNSWVENGRTKGFLSVETQGLADGEWSDYQIDEIVAFIRWASERYGFPLRLAPGYHSSGIGYHVMFGAGEGLNAWSNARGKVCPGPKRIKQFLDIIMPRLTNPQEDDMSDAQFEELKAIGNGTNERLDRLLIAVSENKNALGALIGVADRPLLVQAELMPHLTAIEQMVKAAGSNSGVDLEEVRRVSFEGSQEGVAAALKNVTATVDLNLSSTPTS